MSRPTSNDPKQDFNLDTLYAGGDAFDDDDFGDAPLDRGDDAEPVPAPEPAPAPDPAPEPAPKPEPQQQAEPEPQQEPEPQPEPQQQAEPEPQVDDNGLRVPKYRLDQEVAKRHRLESEKTELERRLQEIQRQNQPQPDQPPQPQAQQEPEPQQPQGPGLRGAGCPVPRSDPRW